jgi:hypothetical protein
VPRAPRARDGGAPRPAAAPVARQDGRDRRQLRRRRRAEDALELVLRRVLEHDLEQEAVELRFGSWYVPSISIGFSVASTKNGRGERVGRAGDGHLLLGHRLEERRLGLRRRAVDLVGEQDVREHGAGDEDELAPAVDASSRRACR